MGKGGPILPTVAPIGIGKSAVEQIEGSPQIHPNRTGFRCEWVSFPFDTGKDKHFFTKQANLLKYIHHTSHSHFWEFTKLVFSPQSSFALASPPPLTVSIKIYFIFTVFCLQTTPQCSRKMSIEKWRKPFLSAGQGPCSMPTLGVVRLPALAAGCCYSTG